MAQQVPTHQVPIAVVGISAIMPDAPTAEHFWANLLQARSAIREVPGGRWDPQLYFDPDPTVPDKAYSQIGGWVQEYPWEPMSWRLPLPPNVAAQMDIGQQWSVSAARSALTDAGWPGWDVDNERVGVIIGNALGGEKHDSTALRVAFPEFAKDLAAAPSFAALPASVRAAIVAESQELFLSGLLPITEDSMPGELANVLAGRVAALFNLRGPNFTTDAACASALAALATSVASLQSGAIDAAITGGLDRNMGPSAFVSFSKIGALSATGSRPFDAAADGFVMGEGTALFVLKRLVDAEAAGDRIYAVIRGVGGSSDGKGKGITAPNPIGQKLAIRRAWEVAGLDPRTIGLLEAHGTSTRVGDAAELSALDEVFSGVAPGTIALGSVKSNIGHLKAAAGAAGLLKAVLSLHHKKLVPSLNFADPNPNIDWRQTAFKVNTELREFPAVSGRPRRAGVSSFGFGGTNFHVALEEYVPGGSSATPEAVATLTAETNPPGVAAGERKAPLRGAAVLGGADDAAIVAQLRELAAAAQAGQAPPVEAPDPRLASAVVRIAIDFADAADLATKAEKALKAFATDNAAMWKMLRSQGVFVGRGPAPRVAFLYTGQGSQYINMLDSLRATEPIVASVYAEADQIMTPLLGRPLSDYVFSTDTSKETLQRLEGQLLQTEITQPAVLTTDEALTELLAAYGVTPDVVMGHSLGEYGALVAAGALTFDAALEAVSARGREMAHVSREDNGAMAAVFGPLADIERIVAEADGYVVIANINSNSQAVIGGATAAVQAAIGACQAAGMTAMQIPVSHAFHTEIVAAASEPLKDALRRLRVSTPSLPIVANVTGDFYPADADVETMLDILGQQVASPVQFVKGLHTLYDWGARLFVEVGPKKALQGFAEEVLGGAHDDVLALFTNHPKFGDIASFNQALCGLYASGLAFGEPAPTARSADQAEAEAVAGPIHDPALVERAVIEPVGHQAVTHVDAPQPPIDDAKIATTVTALVADLTGYPADLLDPELDMEADLGVDTVKQAEVFAAVREEFAIPPDDNLQLRDFPTLNHVFGWVRQSLAGAAAEITATGTSRGAAIPTLTAAVPTRAAASTTAQPTAPSGPVAEAQPGPTKPLADVPAIVTAIVAELTGYPADLLDPDLDMEADLGVDTVKQAEVFAAVRERFAIPAEEDLQLRDFPTLNHVFGWVEQKAPAESGPSRSSEHQPGALLRAAPASAPAKPAPVATAPRAAEVPASERPAGGSTITGARPSPASATDLSPETLCELGSLLAGVLPQAFAATGQSGTASPPNAQPQPALAPQPGAPVTITGAALGLPGVERVFDDQNIARILAGQNFITSIPTHLREQMVDKKITRLVKTAGKDPVFETIADVAGVIKLAGRSAPLDVVAEFGVEPSRDAALDTVTRLAIGAGFDALRDAGIPLVMRYKQTTIGTSLPDRWGLPESMRDSTGVIFASAFPGYDAFATDIQRYQTDRARREQLSTLLAVQELVVHGEPAAAEIARLIADLRAELEAEPFEYDRRFIFRCLSMGHSQFAELIGARGPNTQINAACASATQALAVAEDWIRTGRAQRVIVVTADDVTSETLLPWVGSGFLASGAAATDEKVEDAATPFDRRRHGMIVGMGAGAFVVEGAAAAAERGVRPIAEVLGTVIANSAFHGTRLDVEHVGSVMDVLVKQAESRGYARSEIAERTVFVSHETYTPARGGSAAAEINALRRVFGPAADSIVITNTKGFTGHAMGAGVEDVVAIKALETGLVPPVPNFREADPGLGRLNLSQGGKYDIGFALRLAAGFGSQIAMSLLRWVPSSDGQRPPADHLGFSYRVADPDQFASWLEGVCGQEAPALEVVDRRLRVRDEAGGQQSAAPRAQALAGAEPAAAATQATATSEIGKSSAGKSAVSGVSTTAAAQPAPPSPPVGDIPGVVTGLVAKITGYPSELLDPDLDMEADLGVDTVKQAEVFATVREHYGIPADDSLQLRDFPTLTHVFGWVADKTGSGQAVAQSAGGSPADSAPPTAVGGGEIPEIVTGLVAEITGYSAELLDPELDMEADLGVDTVKQAEVFAAVRERFAIPQDENLQLRDFPTLNHVFSWVASQRPSAGPAQGGLETAEPLEPPAPGESEQQEPAPTSDQPADVGTEQPAPVARNIDDDVPAVVLSLVSQITGYPSELLDPDLDMEADLGVDTVKQAEVFSAVRERYGIPQDENLQLRDFPTLNHVIAWVRANLGGGSDEGAEPQPPAPDSPSDEAVPSEAADQLARETAEQAGLVESAGPGGDSPTPLEPLADLPESTDQGLALSDQGEAGPLPHATAPSSGAEREARFPRRVPVPALRPRLADCLPTGVSVNDRSRIVVGGDVGGVAPVLVNSLMELGAQVQLLPSEVTPEQAISLLTEFAPDGSVSGVYWLPALDDEGDTTELAPGQWQLALRQRALNLHAVMHHLAEQAPFLVAATRLGGQHGYGEQPATAPLGGAVTGFAKAYHRENPTVLVKAVDFASTAPEGIAGHLLAETLQDPGGVEIGYHEGLRWGVGLVERPFPAHPDPSAGLALGPQSVFVITGASGAIVTAITEDLATASGGTFHLLARTAAPAADDPDLALLGRDRGALQQELATRLKQAGQRPTPVAIAGEIARLERAAALRAVIDTITAAGGKAVAHEVDINDPVATASVFDELRVEHGKIDVLVHAAGVEISRPLANKDASEFARVFGVKADGWLNLLHAAGDMPIGAAVAFTSVAGRFGNSGQTDYAAGNDLLCKLVSAMRRTHPATRAYALDWTAWGGIGMASRGSIPQIMAAAGVEMLPADVGVPWLRQELASGQPAGEVLIAGEMGAMAAPAHPTGGLDASRFPTSAMVGKVRHDEYDGLIVEVELDPTVQPFLFDHQIEGTAVLPGVMGIEAFAEAARLLAADWQLESLRQVEFAAPVKFYRGEPRTLFITALTRPEGDRLVAECTLSAERVLPGRPAPVRTVHFRGQVVLAVEAASAAHTEVVELSGPTLTPAEVYRMYFHGPAYQVVGSAGRVGDRAFARMAADLPPNSSPVGELLAQPRLIELCFQTAGLWEAGREGRLGLPARVASVELFTGLVESAELVCLSGQGTAGDFTAEVGDASGRLGVRISGYSTSQLPTALPPEVAEPLQRVMGQ
ncbi:MAG: SDR family NAD(P)-dependent oxidoreductase [Candidatus Nanopelagicales bacterium]